MSTLTVWIGLVVSAFVTGGSISAVLVVRQRAEPVAGLLTVAAFGASIYFIVSITGIYDRVDAFVYALAFFVAAAGAGYSIAASTLSALARRPALPRTSVPSEETAGPAVIIVCCHEPEYYSPTATAAVLKSLEQEGLFRPSPGTLPFLFFAQKARYRALGGRSPSRQELVGVTDKVAAALAPAGVTRVTWANCSGKQRLATRVSEAVAAGHTDIIVTELGVGRSLHLSAAEQEVDAMKLDDVGVTVNYTGPVGDSDRIIAAISRRVTASVDSASTLGVVLVGHGQPESRSKIDPEFDEQETVFLNRMRLLIIEAGVPEHNVRIAWAEWRRPDVTSSVRHLAALGCTRISVMPATYPLDSITSRLDLELATRQSRLDDSIVVMSMSAWKDDDQVVAEVCERVIERMPSRV